MIATTLRPNSIKHDVGLLGVGVRTRTMPSRVHCAHELGQGRHHGERFVSASNRTCLGSIRRGTSTGESFLLGASSRRSMRIPTRCSLDAHGRTSSEISHGQMSALGVDASWSIASSTPEYRAAGYLRAQCFYHYPADRSEFSTRTHRRMRGDMEWNAIENKIAGTEMLYEDVNLTCMVATIPVEEESDLVSALKAELDPTCLLPADASNSFPRMVVACLDINQGAVLPAEQLRGTLPEADADTRRAYLSNICTAPAMRRKRVAAALINEAFGVAKAQGVTDLYVHVAADNPGAHKLYAEVIGFSQESEETESAARRLDRPRRFLLHRSL